MAEVSPSWLVAAEQGAELANLHSEVRRLTALVAHYQKTSGSCPLTEADIPPVSEPARPVRYLGAAALALRYNVNRTSVTHWVQRSKAARPFPSPAVEIVTPRLVTPGWHADQLPDIEAWRAHTESGAL